jgi:endoglucanase
VETEFLFANKQQMAKAMNKSDIFSDSVRRMAAFTLFLAGFLPAFCASAQDRSGLSINELEYFEMPGLNVMMYHDYYAVGRQSGITIIQNGTRVAANGDIRLADLPRFVPVNGPRQVERSLNQISLAVAYPDSVRQLYRDPRFTYPDISMSSTVRVRAEGNSILISVDLDQPLPPAWENGVIFSLELFPGQYFDRSYYMDNTPGRFPRQANGPLAQEEGGALRIAPMATGRKFVALPESPDEMLTVESLNGPLELVDERARNKAGWFSLRSTLRSGATRDAVQWRVTAAVRSGYRYEPVIQVSQVGYRPGQSKRAVIELDKRETEAPEVSLHRIRPAGGMELVKKERPPVWGPFLRYRYAHYDFSDVREPGMYVLQAGNTTSHTFLIHEDAYKRHVWQPTLEYFLPVQMCHMRINDLVKVWHGLCHMDDALMAPVDHVHFDGYRQGPSTLCAYKPFDPVPGLNVGGWHDAGDYDLRVESQANTVRMLAFSYELFGLDYDQTTIDQEQKLVEIHVPDGVPDALQQIEHGVLSILGGYKSLGRLYRGIICPTGRQYSLLGDAVVMTDNLVYDPVMDSTERSRDRSGIRDDRWVFTEDNPRRELFVSACLATAARSLRGYRDLLADDCIDAAKALWAQHRGSAQVALVDAAVELYLTTGDEQYYRFILDHKALVLDNLPQTAAAMGRLAPKIGDRGFLRDLHAGLTAFARQVDAEVGKTPYGVTYTPDVWGAGWTIQSFGVNRYFMHRGFPDIFTADPVFNAMNFVLGVHPGENTASFVSGVGAKSLLVAYGTNRDEWSYIPGGSASGTALIRPDLPELKEWPYFWQQTEYVMGGGATNFMFLVLACDALLEGR